VKKIPTLFVRDTKDRRYVTPEVTPGCEWVLAGEGKPTRKFDGTCVMLDKQGRWWARREVKPDKEQPPGFVAIEYDDETGKTVGWEPVEQSSFAKYHAEAITGTTVYEPGTYELIGPKINGNPENWSHTALIAHGCVPLVNPEPITYATLRAALTAGDFTHEGIVWHHPDGHMAKLKRRDFPKGDDSAEIVPKADR
jgi:hypothetical protein